MGHEKSRPRCGRRGARARRHTGHALWEAGSGDRPSRDLNRAGFFETLHGSAPQVTDGLRRDVLPGYRLVHDRIVWIGQAGDERCWTWLNGAAAMDAGLLALRDGLLEWAQPFHLEVAWILDTALHVLARAPDVLPPRCALDTPFPMPVEDAFAISGHGTVTTARVAHGIVRVGNEPDTRGAELARDADNFWTSAPGPLAWTLAVRGLPLLAEEFPLGTLLARKLKLLHDPRAKREMATLWLTHVRHFSRATPGCLPPFRVGGRQFPEWDPRRISSDDYVARLRNRLGIDLPRSRQRRTAALGSYVRDMKAWVTALGLVQVPETRTPAMCQAEVVTWLVRHVLGESYATIADALPAPSTKRVVRNRWRVEKACERLAREIGLPLGR